MATFKKWVDTPGRRRYGRLRGANTYQDWDWDPGNYNSGIAYDGPLIGTNRSISAPTLSAWRGYPVTREQMMALTLDEAKKIYKVKYWDKIRGDEIRSQLLAEMIADLKSHTGNVKILQNALNALGAGLEVDGAMGTATLGALNRLIGTRGEKAVYTQMRKAATTFYNGLSNRTTGEAGVRHLEKDYPPYEQLEADRRGDGARKKWFLVLFLIALVLGAWYLFYYRKIA